MEYMAKPSLLDEAKGENEGPSEYIMKLLQGVTMAHILHLTSCKFGQHEALGELYESLDDEVDELAEIWMGYTGGQLELKPTPCEMTGDACVDVRNLLTYAEESRALMGSSSAAQAEIDEICSLISTTLYKLEHLNKGPGEMHEERKKMMAGRLYGEI